ncbi:MAG: hypothetical protein R2838_11095 [Caldilineaceae bacterium]
MTDKVDTVWSGGAARPSLAGGVRYGPGLHLPVTTVLAYLGSGAGRALLRRRPGLAPVADTVGRRLRPASPAAKSDVKASPVAQRVAAGRRSTCARSRAAGRAAASAPMWRRRWRPHAPGGDSHAGTGRCCGRRLQRHIAEEGCGSGRGDGDRSQRAGAGGRCERFAAAVASAAHTGTSEDVTTDDDGAGAPLRGMRRRLPRLTQDWRVRPSPSPAAST